MNSILSLIRSIIPAPMLRAAVLQGARWLATASGAAVVGFMLAHGASAADAAAVASAIGGLILALASYGFGLLDVTVSVPAQIVAANGKGAVTAAAAIAGGTTTPTEITAASGSPAALKQLMATLKDGHE